MGNWFGKKNRGLFLGIWNAHTSVGNILGTVVPSVWAVPGQPWYVLVYVRSILFTCIMADLSISLSATGLNSCHDHVHIVWLAIMYIIVPTLLYCCAALIQMRLKRSVLS